MLNLAEGETELKPVILARQDEIGQLANALGTFQKNAIEKVEATTHFTGGDFGIKHVSETTVPLMPEPLCQKHVTILEGNITALNTLFYVFWTKVASYWWDIMEIT
ncbi:hypothetical protein [Enterovibrio nigricans]|nr:hypothetical protein [Enterovibrio nigricans]